MEESDVTNIGLKFDIKELQIKFGKVLPYKTDILYST